MSVAAIPREGEDPGRRRPSRVLGIAFALAALVAAIALLATNPRLLVALTSDRESQALLPASTLEPGTSTTGSLLLANEGLLPLRYDLQVKPGAADLDSSVVMRLRRNQETNYFYQGALTADTIPLGYLAPGQRTRIEVTLVAPRSRATAASPVDETFVWTAHSPGIDYWWWLVVVAVGLVLAAIVAPRLLDLYTRLSRQQASKFELFWRPPVALAAVILAMLVPLSGVSLASVNAQSSNPGNVFEIGQIVFDNTTQDGTTCISAASSGGQTSNGGCGPIFRVFNAVPGTTASGRLTLRNAGTVPIQRLVVWAPQACASASAPNLIHGSGDLCGRVWLSLHDDSHDQCYFPANQAGPCPLAASGTMASFAGSYGPGHELALSPEGLAGGLTYTLRVELDPAAGNEDMGRAASMDFSWGISS